MGLAFYEFIKFGLQKFPFFTRPSNCDILCHLMMLKDILTMKGNSVIVVGFLHVIY